METTRPFRYDLNQIPYSYTVEVTNRLQGLDLIDRVPEEVWMEVHDTVQEAVIKTFPKESPTAGAQIVTFPFCSCVTLGQTTYPLFA